MSFAAPPNYSFPYLGVYETDDIVRALNWVRNNNVAKVINISFGAPHQFFPPSEFRVALDAAMEAGIVIVAAIGNNGELDNYFFPATYPGIIAVGASD